MQQLLHNHAGMCNGDVTVKYMSDEPVALEPDRVSVRRLGDLEEGGVGRLRTLFGCAGRRRLDLLERLVS